MMYTVEITTKPLTGDWGVHRRVLDTVPGTILIEDAEEPVLIFPVEASGSMEAARFVDGVCKLMQLVPVTGRVDPDPEADSDADEFGLTDAPPTTVVSTVRAWMDRSPDIQRVPA